MSPILRLRISITPARGETVCVNSNDRPARATPMRMGMPASHNSSAERKELGRARPVVNFFARKRRPTCQIFSADEKVSTSSTNDWPCQRPASFSGDIKVRRASGRAWRSRISAGVLITASPSQLTLRTRMLSVAAGISAQADFAHAIVKALRSAEDFDFDTHEINGQIAAIQLGEAHGVLLR